MHWLRKPVVQFGKSDLVTGGCAANKVRIGKRGKRVCGHRIVRQEPKTPIAVSNQRSPEVYGSYALVSRLQQQSAPYMLKRRAGEIRQPHRHDTADRPVALSTFDRSGLLGGLLGNNLLGDLLLGLLHDLLLCNLL
jgi:hypothetical protein